MPRTSRRQVKRGLLGGIPWQSSVVATRNDAGPPVFTLHVPSARRPPLPAVTRLALALACLAGLAALALLPAPAGAALPGRNGALIYQGKGSRDGFLYLRQADGSGLRRIHAPGSVAHPVFSPLGRRIAFASLGQVWIVFADGTGIRQITAGPGPSGSPSWSPRGDALAFARGPRRARDIWSVGADGNEPRQITFSPTDDHSPAWSTRDQIAFVRRELTRYELPRRRHGRHKGKRRFRTRQAEHLYVMNPAGTFVGRLTSTRYDDGSPAWSPDGRRIAFTRKVGRRQDLIVMNANGTGARQLTFSGDVTSPAWSPNGRYLVFSAGRSARRALYVMRASGGKRKRVTPVASDASAADWQPVGQDPVIAAGGDIACAPDHPSYNDGAGIDRQCHQRQVSDLLLKMDLWAVLVLGDLQYDAGQYDNFLASFDPTWGRLRNLLRPVPGNHEYGTPGASGYFDYFNGVGRADGIAGPRDRGYYSFDVGTWHIVALNSECADTVDRGGPSCAAGSPQEQWLRADLAAHPNRCTLAFWHHPLVSSGVAGVNAAVQPLWQALYDGGADVLLVGHDHAYERFAPQDANLVGDPDRGIREFLVGTGGRSLQRPVTVQNNTEIRDGDNFGVLALTLHPDGYDWRFVPENPGGFTDAGSAACH
jgi:hypothetical protein